MQCYVTNIDNLFKRNIEICKPFQHSKDKETFGDSNIFYFDLIYHDTILRRLYL